MMSRVPLWFNHRFNYGTTIGLTMVQPSVRLWYNHWSDRDSTTGLTTVQPLV